MAYTDREDLNYLGELFLIGTEKKTPFLQMIGGLNGGKNSRSFQFPMAQPWNLTGASQDTQSEATAAAAGTPVTYTRGQDVNVCQIMKYDAAVTYAKQSTTGEFSGLQVIGEQPVVSELSFQKEGALRQLAIDVEYSFLNGTFVDSNVASTNQTTMGMLEACATNTVDASTADLTKALIDEILRTMAGSGAAFQNMMLFCNAFQMQNISDIYGFAPTDRTVGGVAIKSLLTDFAQLGVVYTPEMPADDILFADVAFCSPVFVPVKGAQVLWTPTGTTAAQEGGFFYTQIGLDLGPEEYHGSLTNLSTS